MIFIILTNLRRVFGNILAQVDVASPPLPSFDELAVDSCSGVVQLDEIMEKITPSLMDSQQQQRLKREHDDDRAEDIFVDAHHEAKKHCPDDEEINAQVQSAIDSILNLQRSDPATDEAVRSILPS